MSQSTAVTADHLRRLACLYVRQSSLQQVHDHQESTARQYALKRRALALGWAAERIVVIDEDLGLSGASAAERTGFQRIVADVGLGGRIPDFPVTRSHPPASWPSAANSSICRTYRKTAGEESRRRSPVANRWMRP